MTWTRALGYVALWLTLTAVYFVPHGLRSRGDGVSVDAPAAPAQAAPAAPYLQMQPAQIVEVEVAAGERRVRATRDGERWLVAEPPDTVVSSDLFSALVSAVLDASGVQVVSVDATRDAEFGLETPEARVRFATQDGGRVDLVLGNENPARTGVYGRASGSPDIVLVGLNARYYVRLILRAVG